MEKVNSLTGAYYVLGYPIAETWDGKYHEIRVRVKRPGVDVKAQPGYFNPRPFSDYSDLEKRIDLVDLALSDRPLSQEPIRFSLGALPAGVDPSGNVHFFAEISSPGLGDVSGRRIEFASVLFDAMDQIVDLKRTELDLTSDVLGAKSAFLYSALSAPAGRYKGRVVLRNAQTGRAAVAGSIVVVPVRESGKTLFFPPLFVIQGTEPLYLGGSSGQVGQQQKPSLQEQIAGAFLFDAKAFSPWFGGSLKSHSSLFASLHCATADGGSPDLALTATLTDESAGTESPIPLTIMAQREGKGVKTYFVKLDLPEVEWGAYVLALVMTDRLRGQSSRITQVISIE
jgi:hypothetical protein